MYSKRKRTEIIEVVISYNSSLINKTVKEINFRGKYDAAIIAIHRNGEKIKGKIGDIKLKAGDVLLLIAGTDFISRTSDIIDFYFISKIKDIKKQEAYKVIILIGGTGLAILLSALGVISLFMALIILFILILSFKIASPKDVHKNIDYNLAIIIAMAMAIGTAMIKTGFAGFIGDFVIKAFIPLGTIGLLFGIYMITTLLAAYTTNQAAVAIIFPISLTVATNLELNPLPFILVVSFAAAANFMTPIGYQTNLMVYGPGRYKFKDFFKIGFPLTIIYMVVTVFILYYLYF
jgi:di/tricarboxylate transporter